MRSIVGIYLNIFPKLIFQGRVIFQVIKCFDKLKGGIFCLRLAGVFFQEYRRDFKRLAAQKKAIFIPVLLNKIITNPAMKSDFFHPNARGYQIIAKRIHQAIAPYLK